MIVIFTHGEKLLKILRIIALAKNFEISLLHLCMKWASLYAHGFIRGHVNPACFPSPSPRLATIKATAP